MDWRLLDRELPPRASVGRAQGGSVRSVHIDYTVVTRWIANHYQPIGYREETYTDLDCLRSRAGRQYYLA